ncbi:MAG: ankyrin repeat domain-containing protein [Phyllobacteriaceae bacterium]|nr:ankyrin repeat domain-containing protein [Phyllobacteriaceae bacterium]
MKPATLLLAFALIPLLPAFAQAQVPPTPAEVAAYDGILRAAHEGDAMALEAAIAAGELERMDGYGRTAVHIAAHASHEAAIAALAKAGADMNKLENDAYDAVTIAAVANDTDMLEAALAAGNKPTNITSRYIGTALIAAAHLGHHEVVRILIEAGAPLDHVNNLGWTAVIESIVLGDGGENHQKTLRHLVEAGADIAIADNSGRLPVDLARERGYSEMVKLLGG